MSNLGLPTTGSGQTNPRLLGAGSGLFSVPNTLQRVYEYGLYSSAKIAAATNLASFGPLKLFGYNDQQIGPGFSAGSQSETNMVVGSLAPGGETYEVSAMACEILGDTNVGILAGDMRAVMRLAIPTWQFGSTLFLQIAPIPMIGSGGGIFGMTGDTATPLTVLNNGNASFWSYQSYVVAIPATQSFAIPIFFGNGGQTGSIALTAAVVLRWTLFNQSRVAIPVA